MGELKATFRGKKSRPEGPNLSRRPVGLRRVIVKLALERKHLPQNSAVLLGGKRKKQRVSNWLEQPTVTQQKLVFLGPLGVHGAEIRPHNGFGRLRDGDC